MQAKKKRLATVKTGLYDCRRGEKEGEVLSFWNQINDAKEAYREKVFSGISGGKYLVSTEKVVKILNDFLETVTFGIEKACILGNGICPTYFTYEVLEYEKVKDGCKPLNLWFVKFHIFWRDRFAI